MGAGMDTPRAIWIDFCRVPQRRSLCDEAQAHCNVLRITRLGDISGAATEHRPQFFCIEFDYPDHASLQALPLVRRGFPSLPALMLSEYHSEALAMWAFRWRVWDYRVKPVTPDILARLLEVLAHTVVPPPDCGWPLEPLPAELLPPAGQLRRPLTAAPRTSAAVAWISEHYGEPIRLEVAAGLCHLCASEFSRVFHREHGSSFRRFLLHYRIARARDLLADPETSISQAAYAVGFNDLSYFGRAFRRVVGVPATRYRRHLRE